MSRTPIRPLHLTVVALVVALAATAWLSPGRGGERPTVAERTAAADPVDETAARSVDAPATAPTTTELPAESPPDAEPAPEEPTARPPLPEPATYPEVSTTDPPIASATGERPTAVRLEPAYPATLAVDAHTDLVTGRLLGHPIGTPLDTIAPDLQAWLGFDPIIDDPQPCAVTAEDPYQVVHHAGVTVEFRTGADGVSRLDAWTVRADQPLWNEVRFPGNRPFEPTFHSLKRGEVGHINEVLLDGTAAGFIHFAGGQLVYTDRDLSPEVAWASHGPHAESTCLGDI